MLVDQNPRHAPDLLAATLELGAFYRTMFAQRDLAVYIIRIGDAGEFYFEDANAAVAALAKRPLDEVRGRTIHEALPFALAECLEANIRRCIKSGRSLTYLRSLELSEGSLTFKTTLMLAADDLGRLRHIVGLTRDITFEEQLFDRAEQNRVLMQGLGKALPSAIYFRDLKARSIQFVAGIADPDMQAWRHQTEGLEGEGGASLMHPDDLQKREEHYAALACLGDGQVLKNTFRIREPDGRYHTILCREMVFHRKADGSVDKVLGVGEDISDRERLEEEMRKLSAQFLTIQMDEQRRLAEELHDSTAQHLSGATLALSSLMASRKAGELGESAIDLAVTEAIRSLEEAGREIRILSYLFHPPLLEDMEFGEAVRLFTTGFGKRTGLSVNTRIDSATAAVDTEVSRHLFRICQEALANVHRHAKATRVDVGLEITGAAIKLMVTDNGIGMASSALDNGAQPGVGLAGMRARIRRLGGMLEVNSSQQGTTLLATVPRSGDFVDDMPGAASG
jgi:signal transduction histidine kinase